MVESLSTEQIQNLPSMILANSNPQAQLVILVVDLVIIFSIYFKFANWIRKLKFSYIRPHLSHFIQKAVLPVFALALISTTNFYIQIYDLFDESKVSSAGMYTAKQTFAKILNSINMLIIGYTLSQLTPIILRKHDLDQKERDDFENWKIKQCFTD